MAPISSNASSASVSSPSLKRAQERRPDIGEAELEEASSAMGYGAVRYADLKNNRVTNYTCAAACCLTNQPLCSLQAC